jgi:DNA-binding cell septation regulator SpoVG
VLVEAPVLWAVLVVVEQHELVVHDTRMTGGCDNLFIVLHTRSPTGWKQGG